jgi:hypothetical protein
MDWGNLNDSCSSFSQGYYEIGKWRCESLVVPSLLASEVKGRVQRLRI